MATCYNQNGAMAYNGREAGCSATREQMRLYQCIIAKLINASG